MTLYSPTRTTLSVFKTFGLLLGCLLFTAACSEAKDDKTAPAGITNSKASASTMQVFKSPTCGCCGAWVDHLDQAGFNTRVNDTGDLNQIKNQFNIAPRYQSCHTGVMEGYVFEGHIPADVIQRFLAEKPEGSIGLAVPGMPVGSPGMEMGERHDDYDVVLLKADGSSEIYQHISQP